MSSSIVRQPISNGIAVGSAELLNLMHMRELQISREEWSRYFRKSMHFALYFGGFSEKRKPLEMHGAGKAAFLCCSYDVITDWRHFDPALLPLFEKQLDRYSSPALKKLAVDLYEKDMSNQLADDGLERGAICFRFVTEMMGIQGQLTSKHIDFDHTGRMLQIVDDVLDYEEDIEEGETNCLVSSRRLSYLQQLVATDIHTHFPPRTPLATVLEIAREKAKILLTNGMEKQES